MPDAIRTTGGGFLWTRRPCNGGFRMAAAVLIIMAEASARAEEAMAPAPDAAPLPGATLNAYLHAFWQLNQHEIAALGLTLGILCFAVVTAISLVRARRQLADLLFRFQKQMAEADAFRTLVEQLPSPIWARDEAGKLIVVNAAYARAVEAKDGAEVLARGIELFDRAAREELFRAHESEKSYSGRLPAIASGSRRVLDVLTFPSRHGSTGIGIDA